MSVDEELAEILKRKSEDMRNVWLLGYQGDIPPAKSIKIASTTDSDVWEVRIRLINAVAGLLAAAGVLAFGLAVVWLVRGA